MPEWISVKDRLPKSGAYVLVYDALNELVQIMLVDCDENWYDDRMRFYCKNESGEITHWMQLPEPPKEESTT